jgi:hypothetical protein
MRRSALLLSVLACALHSLRAAPRLSVADAPDEISCSAHAQPPFIALVDVLGIDPSEVAVHAALGTAAPSSHHHLHFADTCCGPQLIPMAHPFSYAPSSPQRQISRSSSPSASSAPASYPFACSSPCSHVQPRATIFAHPRASCSTSSSATSSSHGLRPIGPPTLHLSTNRTRSFTPVCKPHHLLPRGRCLLRSCCNPARHHPPCSSHALSSCMCSGVTWTGCTSTPHFCWLYLPQRRTSFF